MQHRDRIITVKIMSEIDIALNMIGDADFEEFDIDEMLKRAVCMTVINIGELVKSLSEEFRLEHKEVPWKSIAGFRDIAAHKYQTLNMLDVFHTVENDFPALRNNLDKILNK